MFDDLINDGYVLLEELENGQKIEASIEEVHRRINERDKQTGKWAEYIQKWESEGRI